MSLAIGQITSCQLATSSENLVASAQVLVTSRNFQPLSSFIVKLFSGIEEWWHSGKVEWAFTRSNITVHFSLLNGSPFSYHLSFIYEGVKSVKIFSETTCLLCLQDSDGVLFHLRFWICYGVTPNQFLAVNQTRLEEEVATLVQTLLNASFENMIWSYLYVPTNANMKDMNTCMVKRYWQMPSYGLCHIIVHTGTCLKCLAPEINNFRDEY